MVVIAVVVFVVPIVVIIATYLYSYVVVPSYEVVALLILDEWRVSSV